MAEQDSVTVEPEKPVDGKYSEDSLKLLNTINPSFNGLLEQLSELEFLPRAGRSFSAATIGVIGSRQLREHLSAEIRIKSLEVEDLERAGSPDFDFLLVQLSYDLPFAWRGIFLQPGQMDRLATLLGACSDKGVPAVFYLDGGLYEKAQFAKALEAWKLPVLATTAAVYRELEAEGHPECQLVAPLYSGKLFHPYQMTKSRNLRKGLGFVVPEWAVLAENLADSNWLELARLQNVVVFDDRISRKPSKYPLPKGAQQILMGSVDEAVSRGLWRNGFASLVLDTGVNTHYQVRNVYRSLAFGVPVITTLSRDQFPRDMPLIFANSFEEVISSAEALKGNTFLRDALGDFSLRYFSRHFALCRTLPGLGRSLGADLPELSMPLISMVMPTSRHAFIDEAISYFSEMRYEKREFVIVLNMPDEEAAPIVERYRDRPDVRFLVVPKSEPVGRCINIGIDAAAGEYIAKIDDDDPYGPTYLDDYVDALLSVRFDLAGKVPSFWYETDSEQLRIKRQFWRNMGYYNRMQGGTFFFSKRSGLHYDEAVRGFADLEMQVRLEEQGALLLSVGFFDYVHMRRDAAHHTWQVAGADIHAQTFAVRSDSEWQPAMSSFWESRLLNMDAASCAALTENSAKYFYLPKLQSSMEKDAGKRPVSRFVKLVDKKFGGQIYFVVSRLKWIFRGR